MVCRLAWWWFAGWRKRSQAGEEVLDSLVERQCEFSCRGEEEEVVDVKHDLGAAPTCVFEVALARNVVVRVCRASALRCESDEVGLM
jgi:hypothetical protein